MTPNERELLVRTAVVVGHIASNGAVETEALKAFTLALHNMEQELIANEDDKSHLLKPVLDETKK